MRRQAIYIMGVSGVGKSTIGSMLSKALQIPFFDGDDYHPESNVKKMSEGQALNDEDRLGWLQKLNQLAKHELKTNSCVIVCSALKEPYRAILSKGIEASTKWIFLNGSYSQIKERLDKRKGHYMGSALLKSQFDTLQEPKNAIKPDINLSPEAIVSFIIKELASKMDFGLFGLGVMGKSLSRNLANQGYKLSLYNRHLAGKEENIALDFKKEFKELSKASAFDDVSQFVNSLETPRKIMLMVNAGKTIDLVIQDLLPHLSEGDILIDGGNSNYIKT
ncbi:AAA family ATPase [Marinilabiliaceae bacterium N1Y90]|nr:AAA family ATPase [Marinilabiliaceae bacterium N1Y90]